MSGNGSLVGADETLLRIVEALTESGPAGVTELAERLDLTKSTTHRHLKTLAAHGYAINDGGTYRLSHQWFHVGTVVKSRQPFYVAAKQPLRDLADRTGETAWAAIEEGGRLMFVNGAGSNPTHNPDLLVGDWSPITRTAAGKAILAYLPDDRLDEILVETAASGDGVTPAELRTDLDRIRSRGYAINRGQDISGIYAIGMPVVLDEVAGSLSLASPSRDLVDDGRDAALEALSRAVERVERRLSEREVASGPGSASR
ncbi:IclR family transcriptional regulator [Halobellus rubicundus]|uniref:IclR family transcriptional regulator n=1 Tax=Halobellus rubicundus TaxID=2996466 RepID=A0ABD5MD35_9EURY